MAQMLEVYHRRGDGVIAVEEVPSERVSSYGVIDPESLSEGEYRIRGLVEKPSPEEAPSNLAIVGPIHPAPGSLPRPGADNARRQGGDSTNGRLGSSARIPPPICL